jgi:hypothetical protein
MSELNWMITRMINELASYFIYALIILAFIIARRQRSSLHVLGPTLVLRKFEVNKQPRGNVFVEIVGRASGITAWLLSVLQIDADTTLKVTDKEIVFRTASLSDQAYQVISLNQVSSTHCGYSRPLWMMVVGISFALLGLLSILGAMSSNSGGSAAGIGLFFILVGGGFVVGYTLSKKLSILVETTGGTRLGLSFKRSVIENVSVDIADALLVIGTINERVSGSPATSLVGDATYAGSQSRVVPANAFVGAPVAAAPQMTAQPINTASCGYCRSPLSGNTIFCENCGRQVICRRCSTFLIPSSSACQRCGEVAAN